MRNKSIKMYKKKNGDKNYMFKAYLGLDPITGKRIETTRRGFKSAKEAQRALDRLKVDYDKNGWKNNNNAVNIKNVSDLFHIWIKQKENDLKATSLSAYQFAFNANIEQALGATKLSKITPFVLQDFFNNLAKKYANIGTYRNVLRQMFSYAVKMELMNSNPMLKVDIPKCKPAEHEVKDNFYDKYELANFLQSVKDSFGLMKYTYFRLLAYTGLRRGESLALTWNDLDIENKTISVNKNDVYDSLNHKSVLVTPKTASSIRVLSIDNKTIKFLQQWHLEQTKWKMANGFRKPENEQLIFSNHENELTNPGMPDIWLKKIYKKCPQKKIRLHGFRHTHASLLFETGATVKEVQERLGHSDSKITLQIYTHVVKSRKAETGSRFAKYMDN